MQNDDGHINLQACLSALELIKDDTTQRIPSIQMLAKQPKSTWIKLTRDHSPKIIETFQQIFGLNKAEDLPSKIESFQILLMLEWLPPYEKRLFVEAGIPLWLAGVIPAMMQIVVSVEDVDKIEACLTCTELLAKELVLLNYFQNPHWKPLLIQIVNPELFPATIMGMLKDGKDNWHRIWMVLIKILKSLLVRNLKPFKMPPVNAMLLIVETALKKPESAQVVRAFACWNELIESFSQLETENCTQKRIKLLIVPLKLYNCKTEETTEAKFQTWWHFIHRFRPKIQQFPNEILIYFLHFMFGSGTKPQHFQAIQVSDCLRNKYIDAFAEIMHIDCSNCAITNLKRLDGNVTTARLLTDHWKDFLYALKSCIRAVAQSYTKDTKSKIQCIWMSFVMRLEVMTDDTLRRDMFDDLINLLSKLMLEDEMRGNECLMEIVVDDITLPLWRDRRLKTLIETRSQSHRPMHRIVKLIMDDRFNNYFKRFNSEELRRLLQPLISTLIEELISTPEYIIWLLDELLVTNTTLVMWTALAHASKESKLSLEAFNKILLWPFKTGHVSFEVKEAAEAWYTLYNVIHENLEQTDFDSKISKVLTRPVEDSKASNYFVLFALIGILKHKPDEDKMAKLEALTYVMNDYNDFEQLFIPLVNTIEMMINNSLDENQTQITLNCVENILKVIKSETEAIGNKSPIQNRENTFSNLRAGSDTITSTLKTYLEKCPYQTIKNRVRNLLSSHDKTKSPKKVSETPNNCKKMQELKKSKNKKASIETTVVENGEEYVVVKSNWKFNPKNLTENQKEKLQRKRDIPALYQDLSQSQDEFKLTSWKTDSQNTSMSSSKSATSNDVSDTLKKITNTDIVPKIMENIYDIEKNSKPTDATVNVSPIAKVKTPKADKSSTPGDNKSPRVALKDRVYRNVGNLIRNSSPSSQDRLTDKQGEGNILQNVSKTPKSAKETESIKKKKKTSNDDVIATNKQEDVITTNKQENGSPVTSPPNDRMRQMFVRTSRIDEIMNLACTSVSKTQKDINLHLSDPQTPLGLDRPKRLKRTPKKFDNSLILDFQNNRNHHGHHHHDETTITEIHNPNDKMDVTDAISQQKVSPEKADTSADDLIIVENFTSCAASDDKSPKDVENACLISPKTSTNKATAKSSEKPSTGEVPSNLSQASESVENDAAQNETDDFKDKRNVQTTLSKPKELHKTLAKNLRAQFHVSSCDENAEVNTPVTADKYLNQPKLSANKKDKQNDMDKNVENVEVVPVTINKTKNDSDKSLLKSAKKTCSLKYSNENEKLSRPKLRQKSKVYDVETENIKDDGNLSMTPKTKKMARIENALAIDMVEGHPFIKTQSAKRLSRKKQMEMENGSKGKTLIDKQNKYKLELTPKTSKKDKKCSPSVNSTIIVEDSQDKAQSVSPQNVMDEPPCSEDVIESSQDSTMTTICVKAKKRTPKRLVPVVALEKIPLPILYNNHIKDCKILYKPNEENHESTDIELPQNKSVETDKNVMKNTTDLTENMDTEPLTANETADVIILTETLPMSVTVNSESEPVIGPETQELAEADTQPNDPKQFEKWEINKPLLTSPNSNSPESLTIADTNIENDITQRLPEAALILANMDDTTEVSSPCKDDNQRKQDFLNNTVEISPIKVQSPDRQKKSPSPDTNRDFVVIQLSSPVHSNGEPFDKQRSPEFFTEDKVSPEKQNASPPRVEVIVTNSSPSASLSLKKNRPTSGRAAQMFGLLSMPSDNKSKQLPAKPGLRFYNLKNTKNDCTVEKKSSMEENYLELQRSLPTDTSSPSGPILKRKHNEIIDESTESPASPAKKKRVSFHDPPVSTTVSVRKYIEPISLMRSPQTSAKKRQTRSGLKSPKKLDNAFLASALSKTVESFTEATTPSDETENILIDVTPAVEIVKTSELNDADPICNETENISLNVTPAVEIVKTSELNNTDPICDETENISLHVTPAVEIVKTSELNNTDPICDETENISLDVTPAVEIVKTSELNNTDPICDETENISLDVTPAVEIVKTSELNDTDPICPDLIDCTDPIDVIAIELSSAAMRDLFVKELEGKVDTVGDLAKMTELEVNRLCIKAPKITVAKKVLTDYMANRPAIAVETVIEEAFSEPMTESLLHVTKGDVEMQTDEFEVSTKSTQVSNQIVESGCITAEEFINNYISCTSCISEQEDLRERFKEIQNDDRPSEKKMFRLIMNKTGESSTTDLQKVLKHHCKGIPKSSKPSAELAIIKELVSNRYDASALLSFCTEILLHIKCDLKK